MRVGLEILARRALWAMTPPTHRGSIELWHATFVDTAKLPPPPNMVRILDLGAYRGNFSLAAARALRRRGNGAHLILVEPVFVADTRYAAREISRGRIHASVRAVAVSNAYGVARLYVPSRHQGIGASLYADHRDVTDSHSHIVAVPSVPLADLLMEQPSFDLVKMNIEGAELALNDVEDWILRRVRQWVIEFHHHAFAPDLTRLRIEEAILGRFERLGYTATRTHRYGPTIRFTAETGVLS